MKLAKLFVTALLVPALVSPALASSAVRPSVKPVSAAVVKQDRSLVLRQSPRAGAEMEAENQLMLAGIPLLLIAAGVVVAVAVAIAVSDDETSPGS